MSVASQPRWVYCMSKMEGSMFFLLALIGFNSGRVLQEAAHSGQHRGHMTAGWYHLLGTSLSPRCESLTQNNRSGTHW